MIHYNYSHTLCIYYVQTRLYWVTDRCTVTICQQISIVSFCGKEFVVFVQVAECEQPDWNLLHASKTQREWKNRTIRVKITQNMRQITSTSTHTLKVSFLPQIGLLSCFCTLTFRNIQTLIIVTRLFCFLFLCVFCVSIIWPSFPVCLVINWFSPVPIHLISIHVFKLP